MFMICITDLCWPGMALPDLLPCGYLVGDNTTITITLKGMFIFSIVSKEMTVNVVLY